MNARNFDYAVSCFEEELIQKTNQETKDKSDIDTRKSVIIIFLK